MIMMERFEGLTSAVDCNDDDGKMSLTFNSKNSFNYALKQWTYINDNDDGKFILIANHAGCGADDQRQPYFVSKIIEDTAALTTYLTAQPAPWADVAGTYDLDIGQAIPYQKPNKTQKRGLWGDIVNVGKDVLDAATGSFDLSKTLNFPINIGQQSQTTPIYDNEESPLKLDCINCYVSGSFAVTGHISVDHFSLQDLTLTGGPRNFQAALEMEATITDTSAPKSLQYTKELFSFPIPDAGIEIEGIFKIGAILSYEVGTSFSFSGSATVDFGIQASLPDTAQVVADINDPDSSSATGWSSGTLTPTFDITKESASLKLAAFSQPKLAFGIELTDVGKFDVALTLKLPEISSTFSAEYDAEGVCEGSDVKTGVKLENSMSVELGLEIEANLGGDEESSKPKWSHKLWGEEKPLGELCFPIVIPGLTANATVPSLPGDSTATTGIGAVTGPANAATGTNGPGATGTPNSYQNPADTHVNTAPGATGQPPPPTSTPPATTHRVPANNRLAAANPGPTTGPRSTAKDTATALDDGSADLPLTTIKPKPSSPALGLDLDLDLPIHRNNLAAAVVPPFHTTTKPPPLPKSTIKNSPRPKTTKHVVPAPVVNENARIVEHNEEEEERTETPPKPKKKVVPVPAVVKPKTSKKKEASVVQPTPVAGGGGGCRMARRLGRRMLIC